MSKETKSKAPAFQFYAGDFLVGIMGMDDAEVGIYIKMLALQWEMGALPGDVKSLRKLLGSRTNPSEIVLGKFDLCDDGKLRNSRLEKEREKQLSFRKTRSENAMKRWHVDCIGNARASKVHEHSESKCNALHTSSSISTSKDVDGANTDASPAAPKKRNVTDEEFLSELRPLYPHLDIEAEMRRATAWLLTPKARGRKLTRQFLVNWLNRADAPIMKDESQAPSASRFADMLTPKE